MEAKVNYLMICVLLLRLDSRLAEYLAIVSLALILLMFVRVRLSPAYKQRRDEVVTRNPGQRLLGAPVPAIPFALEDVDFALLSQVAYDSTPTGQADPTPMRNAKADLDALGWTPWPPFGAAQGLPAKLQHSHLRVEVWVHKSKNYVAVAFGGTVFTNVKDWLSNLRWFVPFHEDEYTETVHIFGPSFVEEFVTKIRPIMVNPSAVAIFSTGHSLGGGLAQQFGYALPLCPFIPRVQKVYAFDPSPVTGFFSVGRTLRTQNKDNLMIDRIYERGEILAYLRSITNFIHEPSAQRPEIRQIRYNLFKGKSPVFRHSIRDLADGIRRLTTKASAQRPVQTAPLGSSPPPSTIP
jgi:hypothetical protein